MSLLPGKKNLGRNIRRLEREGRPPKQAIAIAERVAGNPRPPKPAPTKPSPKGGK